MYLGGCSNNCLLVYLLTYLLTFLLTYLLTYLLLGYETYDICIKELRSGEIVDTIHSCSGDVVWGADDSTVFYTKMDDEHRPFEVWLHVIGA